MHAILVVIDEGSISAWTAGEAAKPWGLAEGLRAGNRVLIINWERNIPGGVVPSPQLTSPLGTVQALT